MPLSNRERVILITAAALVGVFLLDQLALTPAWQWRQDLADRRQITEQEARRVAWLIDQYPILEQRWKKMTRAGLAATASDAESEAYHAIRDWAHASGLRLQAINPERVIDDSTLPIIAFRATGIGPMRAISAFLKHLDESSIALRIEQLQIVSRRDGQDDLTLELRLSTLFNPEPEPTTHVEEPL